MKRLCLAVVLVFLGYVNNARADRYADFVRVECNKTFGFLDIQYNSLTGNKIEELFHSPTSYFKYSTDGEVLDSEIYFINNFYKNSEPFVLECEFSPLWSFDVKIDRTDRGDCQYATNNLISITEKSRVKMGEALVERKLLNHVSMGCEGKVNRIIVTNDSYSFGNEWNKVVHVDFVYNASEIHFYESDQKRTITDEVIDEEIKELKEHSKETE